MEEPYGVIYKTTNLINGKTYIGQHIYKRKKSSSYFGSGIHIKASIKKYGKINFEKEVIFECFSREQTDRLEKLFIALLKPDYNISSGGSGNLSWSPDRLETMRKKMSGSNNPNYGKKHTNEMKEKNRRAHLGKIVSEYTKIKMRESSKHTPMSLEHKSKLRTILKGRVKSEEELKKQSISHKGIPWSEARRQAQNKRNI
jgi:group I intron endonuclease